MSDDCVLGAEWTESWPINFKVVKELLDTRAWAGYDMKAISSEMGFDKGRESERKSGKYKHFSRRDYSVQKAIASAAPVKSGTDSHDSLCYRNRQQTITMLNGSF